MAERIALTEFLREGLIAHEQGALSRYDLSKEKWRDLIARLAGEPWLTPFTDHELERLAIMEVGHPVVMLSSWGATETAPACTDCHFQAVRSGVIGVPVPSLRTTVVCREVKTATGTPGEGGQDGIWR